MIFLSNEDVLSDLIETAVQDELTEILNEGIEVHIKLSCYKSIFYSISRQNCQKNGS